MTSNVSLNSIFENKGRKGVWVKAGDVNSVKVYITND
jgi:hypothetical protein